MTKWDLFLECKGGSIPEINGIHHISRPLTGLVLNKPTHILTVSFLF